MNARLSYWVGVGSLAATYMAAGAFGLWWAVLNDYISPVWPPTGFAIAALLVFGSRLWPGVFIGAFAVNLYIGSPLIAAAIAVGNTLEAYVAALLVQRFAGGARAFFRPQDSFKYVLLAALLSTGISASVGVVALVVTGSLHATAASAAWVTWWLGDMVSAITIAPLLLVLRLRPSIAWSRARSVEALGLLVTLVAIALLVFGNWSALAATHYPVSFFVLPPLLWAAYRFGPHGAVTASFFLSVIALLATRAGLGPFALSDLNTSLLLLQAFIGTAMFSALVLAAVVQQERDHEQVLIAQTSLLRAQNEASPDGYLVVAPDGRMLSFNQRFADLWGFTPELLASGSDDAALEAARAQVVDGDRFIARVKQLYASGNEQSHEEIFFKDGRTFERHGVPIKTESNRYLGFVWYFRDISARKRAENALREKEQRIRLLLDATGEAMYGVDAAGHCTFVNAACLKLLGYKHEQQLLRREVHALSHYGDDGSLYAVAECPLCRPLANGESVYRQELQIRRKDGTRLPIEFSSYPIRKDRTTVGAVVTFADISERRRAHIALRQAEERVRVVIGNLPVILYALNRDGVITLSEGKGLEALGVVSGELVGKSVFELYRDGPERTLSNMRRALAGESFSDISQVNGAWFETYFAPLYDEHGALAGTTGVSLNVTQQRLAEEEVFRASKLESIGVLAGGIAHDFNNILTAIIGNLALARLYAASDELVKCLSESEKAALRARGLTQQLLAFSKGGKPIKKAFLLSTLLPNAAEFALQGSNVRADVKIAHDLWAIDGDEGQLNQVIHNLVINAQQAMPHGGVIEIRADNVEVSANDDGQMAPGEYVRISVRDSGNGIPAQDLPKIFDPFFTTKPQGSGLGLTSSYWIVQRHDGYIGVESETGRGTAFTVHLPRTHTSVIAEADMPPFVHGRGKLLVMDDEVAIREFIDAMLTHLGYRVVTCADGAAALVEYQRALERGEPFDAVILDLTVRGGMGGKEALTKLRQIDPQVKAAVSSGYSNDPVMADYAHYGFNACIVKPYHAEALSQLLPALLTDAAPQLSPRTRRH